MRYAIYVIVGPTGRVYAGLSIDPDARWASHRRKARTQKTRHPFYDALRKYGPEQFTMHVVSWHETLEEAQAAEIQAIAAFGPLAYNVSPGGEYDAGTGGRVFWQEIKKDPERYAAYLRKLSEGVKATSHLADRSKLKEVLAARPAKDRWKQQHRITRLARGKGAPIVYGPREEAFPRTAALLKSRTSRLSALATHAARSEEDRAAVNIKIAESLTVAYAEGSSNRARLAEVAAKGRANMDRKVQGAAASKGLKGFWAEIKKDPERYATYMASRNKTLLETLERKKNANL